MNTTIYSVPDMSCGHCKGKIEKEVNQLDGVSLADANVADKMLTVTFDESKVSNDDIVNAVSEAGYTAEKK